MSENTETLKAEIDLIFERATKNTWKFEEVTQPGIAAVLNSLYVQKSAFKKQPDRIKVTIEVVD